MAKVDVQRTWVPHARDPRTRAEHWIAKGGFAVADQAVFSGSNFVLNILLARWLSPAEYGAFALAFSFFLFAAGIHNALLLEPMTVYGPSKGRDLGAYFRRVLRINAGLAVALAVPLVAGGGAVLYWGSGEALSSGLLGLGIWMPATLLYWTVRRACYLEQESWLAFRGSTAYGVFLVAGLGTLSVVGKVTVGGATIVMGFSGLLASMLLLPSLRRRWSVDSVPEVNTRLILRENWLYGRWAIGTGIVYWLSGDVYYLLTSTMMGLNQTGSLRALQNLILPASHAMTALGMLILPWAVRRLHTAGMMALGQAVVRVTWLMTSLAIAYLLVVVLVGKWLIGFLYGDRYVEWVWLLPLVAGGPVLAAVASGCQVGLRAARSPKSIFHAHVAGAVVSITVGVLMTHRWGLPGAVGGGLLTLTCQTFLMWVAWTKVVTRWTGPQIGFQN